MVLDPGGALLREARPTRRTGIPRSGTWYEGRTRVFARYHGARRLCERRQCRGLRCLGEHRGSPLPDARAFTATVLAPYLPTPDRPAGVGATRVFDRYHGARCLRGTRPSHGVVLRAAWANTRFAPTGVWFPGNHAGALHAYAGSSGHPGSGRPACSQRTRIFALSSGGALR